MIKINVRYQVSCGIVGLLKGRLCLIKNLGQQQWTFPKGKKQDKDKSHIDTAQRQLKEQTNLSVVKLLKQQPYQQYYQYQRKNSQTVKKSVFYFLAQIEGQAKCQQKQISQIGFFTLQQTLEMITYNEDKKMLQELKKYII